MSLKLVHAKSHPLVAWEQMLLFHRLSSPHDDFSFVQQAPACVQQVAPDHVDYIHPHNDERLSP